MRGKFWILTSMMRFSLKVALVCPIITLGQCALQDKTMSENVKRVIGDKLPRLLTLPPLKKKIRVVAQDDSVADPASASTATSRGMIHTRPLPKCVTLPKKIGTLIPPEPSYTSPAKTMSKESESKAKCKRKAYQLKEEDTMWQPSCCKLDSQPIKKTDSVVVDSNFSLAVSHNKWTEHDMFTFASMDPDSKRHAINWLGMQVSEFTCLSYYLLISVLICNSLFSAAILLFHWYYSRS